jgi:hypothetical protein
MLPGLPGVLSADAVLIGAGTGLITPLGFAALAGTTPQERLGQTMGTAELGRELGDAPVPRPAREPPGGSFSGPTVQQDVVHWRSPGTSKAHQAVPMAQQCRLDLSQMAARCSDNPGRWRCGSRGAFFMPGQNREW